MDTALACAPRNCSARWDLAGGHAVTVRPVVAEDLQLESEFVARGLTQQSRYQRFQTALRELPPGMAAYLTDIDYRQHFALLALVEDDGRPRQVGEVRYVCDGALPDQAEFALAVADDWQGRGLGARLLRQLVRVARRHGVRLLYGDVLRTNQAMLALARSQGFVPQRQGDARLVRMALALDAAPAPAPAHSAGGSAR
ncbi:GNAT family N-acetyltransferase [Pseudorhodoferax sp.]|uniref:GNAT family N-acetyltransferase n=1 Tax=Pseudorhodoferax sp. TaxID=1993553 RepID=UPI002DD6287E|nr:GNAT family N-acetyltransferase [Pseudorhodoferax sp.]